MNIALIFAQHSRGGIGDRCYPILKKNSSLNVECFTFDQFDQIPRDFDLYLRLDDDDYGRAFPKDLHPYVWWVPDTHIKHSYRKIKANAADCDYLMCFQKEGVETLKKEGFRNLYWVPASCDKALDYFKFIPFKERKWDACFIGTTGKFSLRKVMLEKAKINFPNSFIGSAHWEELSHYYAQARVSVNFSINNDINMRTFEAMGAGALVVTNKIFNNGFEDLFKDGEHLVTYKDITTHEFEDKIRYYLEHPDEAEQIALNGFELVQKKHTYRNRLQEILAITGKQVIL